jgi:hypothetical protein
MDRNIGVIRTEIASVRSLLFVPLTKAEAIFKFEAGSRRRVIEGLSGRVERVSDGSTLTSISDFKWAGAEDRLAPNPGQKADEAPLLYQLTNKDYFTHWAVKVEDKSAKLFLTRCQLNRTGDLQYAYAQYLDKTRGVGEIVFTVVLQLCEGSVNECILLGTESGTNDHYYLFLKK